MTVLEAVQKSKTLVFMHKGAINAAQKLLTSTEEILWAMTASVYKEPVQGELRTEMEIINTDMLPGVIVVTNWRILFVHNSLGIGSSKDIPLSSIRSMDVKNSLTFEALRIVGTSDMIVTIDKRKNIENLRNAINEALSRRSTPKPAAPAQASDEDALLSSDIEQLQALKQLYDTGVITAEEFAAKKAQILNL